MLRVQNPPSVEEQDFQQQSHATGLDHTQFCQLKVLTAIFFSQIDGENQACEDKEIYTVCRRCRP